MTTKRHAPATERNREPILGVLREELPREGLVLEIASGSGEHAVYFAAALPSLTWQPTDADADARASIEAWRSESGLPNVRPSIPLDAAGGHWDVPRADAVVCINMIHIAPWRACEGLLEGAARVLTHNDQPLILYGPFFREEEGVPTAPSNLAFDQSLRARNEEWGVRRLVDVREAAEARDFRLARVAELPSNNCAVVFRRTHRTHRTQRSQRP